MATVSEFAFEYSADTREAYDLARLILVELLNGASLERGITDRHFRGTGYCIDRFERVNMESLISIILLALCPRMNCKSSRKTYYIRSNGIEV